MPLTPDSPSAVHLHHLQLLLFLGNMTTSGFHGDVKVSCLTVGTHLKQLQKRVTGNLFILDPKSDNDNDDYQETLSQLGRGCSFFPLWPAWKNLRQLIFVGDITHQQPATTSVMSRVLMLQLAFIYLK